MYFAGCLLRIGEPSDTAPSGAIGHRVMIPHHVIARHKQELLGCPVKVGYGHIGAIEAGRIEDVEVQGSRLLVYGSVDLVHPLSLIEAEDKALGMSYEISKVHVQDMRCLIWTLLDFRFTGSLVLPADKAAYKSTQFLI